MQIFTQIFMQILQNYANFLRKFLRKFYKITQIFYAIFSQSPFSWDMNESSCLCWWRGALVVVILGSVGGLCTIWYNGNSPADNSSTNNLPYTNLSTDNLSADNLPNVIK
jgi:hypothetical protein